MGSTRSRLLLALFELTVWGETAVRDDPVNPLGRLDLLAKGRDRTVREVGGVERVDPLPRSSRSVSSLPEPLDLDNLNGEGSTNSSGVGRSRTRVNHHAGVETLVCMGGDKNARRTRLVERDGQWSLGDSQAPISRSLTFPPPPSSWTRMKGSKRQVSEEQVEGDEQETRRTAGVPIRTTDPAMECFFIAARTPRIAATPAMAMRLCCKGRMTTVSLKSQRD
jgi:hypothetical protein